MLRSRAPLPFLAGVNGPSEGARCALIVSEMFIAELMTGKRLLRLRRADEAVATVLLVSGCAMVVR